MWSGGDRAWWVIESVFRRSPDKGFWACLGDLLPDMPRRPVSTNIKHPHILGIPDKAKSHVTLWACAENEYAEEVTLRCLDQYTTLTY